MATLGQTELNSPLKTDSLFVVRDPPKFDLDAYIANYAGRTRFDRLYLIGCTSTYLAVDALRGAVIEAKQGRDVSRYDKAVAGLQSVAPRDPMASLDTDWMERAAKQVAAETERLEIELKGYKNNLIKESIRMGHEDLGSHYHAIGELSLAFQSFSHIRDYCTTTKHVAEMCLKLILVAIEQANWLAVQSNVQKIRGSELKPEDQAELLPKLSAVMGLAEMSSGNYRDAAESFLQTEPSLGSSFNQVLSANDVAVYGGLCVLASMGRDELQTRVLDNAKFRNFLELEPHIRRAIAFFCSSKYSQCLEILEAYKADYLLDIHLQRHVHEIYAAIRSKSIIQFVSPFGSVAFDRMAKAFTTDEQSLEQELIGMIERGLLKARIDTQHKLLTSKPIDPRKSVHHDTLEMAKRYERSMRLRLLRINLFTAGLEVRSARTTMGSNHNPYVGSSSSAGPIVGDVYEGTGGLSALGGSGHGSDTFDDAVDLPSGDKEPDTGMTE